MSNYLRDTFGWFQISNCLLCLRTSVPLKTPAHVYPWRQCLLIGNTARATLNLEKLYLVLFPCVLEKQHASFISRQTVLSIQACSLISYNIAFFFYLGVPILYRRRWRSWDASETVPQDLLNRKMGNYAPYDCAVISEKMSQLQSQLPKSWTALSFEGSRCELVRAEG